MKGPRVARILPILLLTLGVLLLARGTAQARMTQETAWPEEMSVGWWDEVQASIAQSEYEITWQEQTVLPDLAAYQAPNRAHNFRTYFTPEGVRLTSRQDATDWQWRMTLHGYGPAALVVEGDRIEYQRDGLTEWYANSPQGLRQGFRIEQPTNRDGQPQAMVLELVLDGDIQASVSEDAQLLELATPAGVQVLHYGELRATDARSRELEARISLEAMSDSQPVLRLTLDTARAVFPIRLESLITVADWSAESDQQSSNFGYSVGTAGDVNSDGFDDVIVGAYSYDNGQSNEGRAYVYHGSAAGLNTNANWTAESNQADAEFGRSLGTAGDVNGDGYDDVIVSAQYYDNGQNNEGRAYVYYGSAAGLGISPNWTAEANKSSSVFATSVSTAGDVNGDGYDDVIVGAPYYDPCFLCSDGRVFVYHGSAAGLSLTANWYVDGDVSNFVFGDRVATAGDVNGDGYDDVIVADSAFFNSSSSHAGRAYVYHGSAVGLSMTANWAVGGSQTQAQLGESVSTAGDVNGDGYDDIIIGAPGYGNGQDDEGAAFVYHGSAAGLSTIANWTAEGNQSDAELGTSVRTAGDFNGDGYADVVVGAPGYDNELADEGRATIYYGSAVGLSTSPDWTREDNQAGAAFGVAVGTAGDVNGDSFDDVLIGATGYDNGEGNEGRAFAYHGSVIEQPLIVDDAAAGIHYDGWLGVTDPQALGGSYRTVADAGQKIGLRSPTPREGPVAPDWTKDGDKVNRLLGRSIGAAGDVNGDGYPDVIAGGNGLALVFHGSSSGLSNIPDRTLVGDQSGSEFGYSVATAGDVNGDGFDDVIIGAPYYSNDQNTEGRALVYHGSGSGLSTTPNWTAESDQADAYFGTAVGTARDVNGDGFDDVIVGADYYDNGQTDEGRAYVYYGSADGLNIMPNWTAESDKVEAGFGNSVATAGDVNGDGFAEVIVGVNGYGAAVVYHGSAAGLNTTEDWIAQSRGHFGVSVGTAGDVNRDGYDDVIVGMESYANGQDYEGAAFVYHGSAAGLSITAKWMDEGNSINAEFGSSVSTAGDMNGDGFADVIVGADRDGRAYVYHGSATGLSETANWTAEGYQSVSDFGRSVGTAGDVNRDGYGDVVVGEPSWDGSQYREGQVHVYHGSELTMDLALITYRGPDQGMAEVSIDGQSQGVIDLYAPTPEYQVPVTFPDLSFVHHLVTVEVLGQGNPASNGTEVRVDAFWVTGGIVTQDDHPSVFYGRWAGTRGPEAYNGTLRATNRAGGLVSFSIEGPRFTWITARGPQMGQAEVVVDGAVVETVDLYNAIMEWQYPVVISGLADTVHTIEIRVLGTQSVAATNSIVVFDAYRVP